MRRVVVSEFVTAAGVIEAPENCRIHIVPVLLGDGTRLFDHVGPEHIEMGSTRMVGSPRVTPNSGSELRSKTRR